MLVIKSVLSYKIKLIVTLLITATLCNAFQLRYNSIIYNKYNKKYTNSLLSSNDNNNENINENLSIQLVNDEPPVVEASVKTSSFNLAKSLIGAAAMSFPNGVMLLSDSPIALVPAISMCLIFGLLSSYSFSVIGKVCHVRNCDTFQEAWESTVNKKTAWLVTSIIAAPCFFTALAYSIIIGDTFASLAETFSLPLILQNRTNIILLVSSLVLLPLCSLKSLAALTPFSIVGLFGTVFTALFMTLRLFQGAYLPGGKFYSQVALKPILNSAKVSPTVASLFLSPKIFMFMSMVSSGYLAHFGAPTFYLELKRASVKRFNRVVRNGFSAAFILYVWITVAGFLTFGGNCHDFILSNYARNDVLATIARIMIGISMITTFPFPFAAIKSSAMDLFHITDPVERERKDLPITIIGITLLTGLALVLREVGFVVSLSGALFGYSLMFIIPMIMNIAKIKRNVEVTGKKLSNSRRIQMIADYLIIAMAIAMTAISVTVSVRHRMGLL